MMKADIIIKNALVVTMDRERRILEDAVIIIVEDKIEQIGSIELLKEYKADKIIDAKGKFVFPGFISTHTHLFQVMLKGLGRDKTLFDWLDSSVRRAIHKIDKECCHYAALTGCIEAIRTGTTTVLDYMYCHGQPDLDIEVLKAFEKIGIRGVFGRGHTNTDSFPKDIACPYKETEEVFLSDVENLAKEYQDHPRISIAIAPGIIWDITENGFRKIREIADKYKIPITMHLVETEDDDEYLLKAKGIRTIPYLEKVGILGPDFIAVHCVHVNDEDRTLLKKYDVKISHNPVSNMILASGIAPIPKYLEEGMTVSLACDGAASNDTQDMLEVIKTTALLHKVNTRNAAVVSAGEVLEMATLGGAKSLRMEDRIGSIEVGKKADMFIYNPINARSIPVHDPVSTIVYSSAQPNVETTIIDGKVILEAGKFVTVNEEEILHKTQEIAAKLVHEAGLGNIQWDKRIKLGSLRS